MFIEYDKSGLFSCFTDGENHVEENYNEITDELYNKLLEYDMVNSSVIIENVSSKALLSINDIDNCFILIKKPKTQIEILQEKIAIQEQSLLELSMLIGGAV